MPSRPGYFVDSSRNVIRGRGVDNLDLSMFRNVPLEHLNIDLRFESFNALNDPEFGFPNASVNGGAGNRGAIISINLHYPQRQKQGGIRLVF